jgi:repressor of nif and glnA expression
MLLVPTLDEHECLKAYRNGAFYGVIRDTGLRFTNISFSGNTFSASTNRAATMRIVTNAGSTTYSGTTSINYAVQDSDVFVRVEAIDDTDTQDGIIFSNAIMLKTKEEVEGGGDEPDVPDDPEPDEDEEKQRFEKRKRFLLLHANY